MFRLVLPCLTFSCGHVDAAEFSEPNHGITVAYDEALWSASLDDQDIELTCKTATCGGDSVECGTVVFETKPGLANQDFVDTFRRDYATMLTSQLKDAGWEPVLVDPPALATEGDKNLVLFSFRLDKFGTSTRIWSAEMGAPFGVLVLQCYTDEAAFAAARPQLLALVKGIAIRNNPAR